jgi:hypothetical protein
MAVAFPKRGTVITRDLAECQTCTEMIYRAGDQWKHNRTGVAECGGTAGYAVISEFDLNADEEEE